MPRIGPAGGRRSRRGAWRLTIAAAASALLPIAARAAVWTNTNPGGGGAFTCVAAGANGSIIVGSDIGGVYRSDNHGSSWQNVGALGGGLIRSYISSVAFDPSNGWYVYLGTDGGLYLSGNAGKSFSVSFSGGFWSAIAVAPSDPNIVYAARQSSYSSTDPMIWKSLNKGVNWLPYATMPLGTRIIKLEVQPNNSSHLLAVSGYEKLAAASAPLHALYVSNNGGANFTNVHGDSTAGGMSGNPWDATYDPIHPDSIFCTTALGGNVDESATWSGYTWRGRQSGGAWTQVSAHTGAVIANPATGEIMTVDVRRDGPGCSECGTWKTANGGTTWTHVSDMTGWDPGWIGAISWAYNAATSGVAKTLGKDPTNTNVIYWVTPQFVWRSTNWGASFGSLCSNPATPGFWTGRGINNVAPATMSAGGSMLYAGFYDLGIWRSLNGGASWQPSNDVSMTGEWDGRGGCCMTILADPARTNVVWAGQGENMTAATVVKNTNSAVPGSWTTTTGIPLGFTSGLALDAASPSSNRTLYVSSDGDAYKSVDDGQTWNKVFNCDSCYVNAASGSTVFTGGSKGLWRSLDGGANWTELAPSTFHLGPNAYPINSAKWSGPHAILISGGVVYVANYGSNRGFYKSLDNGNTWSLMRADDFAINIHIDANGWIYLGSSSATNAGGNAQSGSTGITISRDSGATWTSLNTGLPWPFAWPIATMPAGTSSIRLFVGASGSGIWTSVTSVLDPLPVGEEGGPGLGLVGFRPNPAHEGVSIAFSLPTPQPAVVEVFDIAGRRVFRRDVGWMGAGSHLLTLGAEFRPAPGLYNIRLVQAGREVKARSVVVR